MRATPIGSLISPIHDESGFGVLCRTAKLMGFNDLKTLMNYLIPSAINNDGAFPEDIDLTSLAAWSLLTMQMSLIEAVDRFSNLPLYRPFLTEPHLFSFQNSVDRTMLFGPPRWWKPLGMEGQNRSYCIQCIREQYEMYGFATWLRSQNVGRVVACAVHGVELVVMPASKRLAPPIDLSKDARKREGNPATAEAVFHAKYVSSLLDSNLPWIPADLQSLVIRNRSRYKPVVTDLTSLSLSTRLWPSRPRDPYSQPSVNIVTILRSMEILFADIELFKELHLDAAAKFDGRIEADLRVTLGKILTLKVGNS